jgi:hypothetical protein
MDSVCSEIRKKLCRLGWNPKQREIVAADGNIIWIVFNNQASRSFSVQAHTQQEAWESAWQLVGKMQKTSVDPQMILQFPVCIPTFHRAA